MGIEMYRFGETMRTSALAIGLGFLTLTGVATVTAPAAFSQNKTKNEEFAKAYNEAKTALTAGKYADALPKIEAAAAAAKDSSEKIPVADMRVAAYGQLKKYPELIKAIETRQALGNVPASTARNHKEMLAGAYAATRQTDKAVQITKELINETGGTSLQLAYVANYDLTKKQYDEAISYANKAIDKAKTEGKKANSAHYNIVLTSYRDTGKMDQYYATLERVAPMFNSAEYWKPLIEKAKKEPKYKSEQSLLDIYRTMEGANIKLSDQEKMEMADMAFNRQLSIEVERIMTPMVKAGTIGGASDPKAESNKKKYEKAVADAKADKAGGLDKLAVDAATKETGDAYVRAGEAYYAAGDYTKASDMIQKGLTKGQMEPGATELAKLRLGMAQYKAGKKADAQKTWSEVKSDNGASWLARVWTAISKA